MRVWTRYLVMASLLAGLTLTAGCSTPEGGGSWDKDTLWKEWDNNRSR
jgi:predicted small secreted protein